MKTCCNTPINKKFDQAQAKKEWDEYLQSGPKKTTLPLLEGLGSLELSDATALDIGGGVGAVLFQLFEQGVAKAQSVDISEAYCEVLQEALAQRNLAQRVKVWNGDFLCLHDKLPPCDLVTLDKVICCYENFHDLVQYSLGKANRWYAYTIPRDIWWVKWGHGVKEFFSRWGKDDFRTFVHPVHTIEKLIEQQGFEKHWQVTKAEWLYTVYQRT